MELERRQIVEMYTSDMYRDVIEPLLKMKLEAVYKDMETCEPQDIRFHQGRAYELRQMIDLPKSDMLVARSEEMVEAEEQEQRRRLDERRRTRSHY